jgi:signal transduction histidine kinase
MLQGVVSERRFLPTVTFATVQKDHPSLAQLFALGRQIAFISHDLRQPLTAILANAEFLARPDIGEAQRVVVYGEIRSDVDRINELVSSLLECSKGRDILELAAGNIVRTVERAIRTTSVSQKFRKISIKHHHKGRAVGWFDANRLERVVVNGKSGGNGLGLAIAKKLVDDHGGRIRLEESSEAGTLFKITIPFAIRR